MNRKLISSQPLREDLQDLDDIGLFQSQVKKVTFDASEETKDNRENSNTIRPAQTQDEKKDINNDNDEEQTQTLRKTTKRYHQLQVIDEDAEHFKTKLDNLINNFRTETMSEFMSIKRNLLEEQTEAIEGETRKYSKLLENRTNELDRTKEALAKKIKELERAEVIAHVVADWAGIARTKRRNVLLLSKCFNGFKSYKASQDTQTQFKRMADSILNKKTIARVFGSWKTMHTETKEEKLKKEADSTLNRELADLAAKYNKEIDMLTKRLDEALRNLDEAEKNKQDIQENLKKAFMRGVCALNFEAMSILKPGEQGADESLSDQMAMTKQTENITQGNPNFNSLVLNPVDDNMSQSEDRSQSSPKKNIVFYQNPKLESKDMRWREAPVVGNSQNSEKKKKESILKPSTYIPRENKENEMEENSVDHFETPLGTTGKHHEDEGRVIKVNNGKSFSATGTHSSNVATGKQVKASEKTVTVNVNKAAQLKASIAKGKK